MLFSNSIIADVRHTVTLFLMETFLVKLDTSFVYICAQCV